MPLLDDVAGREAERERSGRRVGRQMRPKREKADPFDEIDFGSYFQDYLDPGFRTQNNFEITKSLRSRISYPSPALSPIISSGSLAR